MATQYRCNNEKRRQKLFESTSAMNGIDYLEVLHGDAPKGTIPQRTLLVRMLKEAPTNLVAGNVEITGGVRVTTIKVEWVIRAAEATDWHDKHIITKGEADYLSGLTDRGHVLVIRTNMAGDFSPYQLRLVQPKTPLTPPQTFDPILSQVEFFFKVECPSDFDCKPETECPPEKESEPQIDYLSKDYASFRQLMLDRLSTIMPDWKERNAADVGIAMVEVLAYAGDYLSYYQDAAATEAYLGTARKRVSMRRHARLLDYPMHDGCNARTWVHFNVDADNISLEKGTQLLTRINGIKNVIQDQSEYDRAFAQQPTVFETMHDATFFNDHNSIEFYTWGDEECCLPKGATRATLTKSLPKLKKDDVLIFIEERNPENGNTADADATHRHAVRLTKVEVSTDLLLDSAPVTEIEWMTADALPFPLCLHQVVDTSQQTAEKQPVSVALGNIVLADHGRTIEPPDKWRTVKPEYLDPIPAGRRGRLRLKNVNLTHSADFRFENDEKRSAATVYGDMAASELLSQDVRKALPSVMLNKGESESWRPQLDLLNSDRFAPEFVVEMEEDGCAYIRFGDGTYGKLPAADDKFAAIYRIGNGRSGNIGAEAIAHVITTANGITGVRNPLPAQGGVDPESIEEVRQYAPQAFRTQERAVTEADYAEVAQRHPEVQKAIATRRWTGSWHTMFLTIDRKGGFGMDDAFEAQLRQFLEKYRLAGQDLEIEGPSYVPLDISFGVCVQPGYFRNDVEEALLETFGSTDLPDGRRGFFHPDNFTFGQRVYLSELLAKAMQVPGVRWVNTETKDNQTKKPTGNRFKRWGQPAHGELEQGWIEIGRLEIARLDNDPNAPENGKLEFIMEGGL